jgi:gamma-glutamyltranspeptidase/glutathione hydrolase
MGRLVGMKYPPGDGFVITLRLKRHLREVRRGASIVVGTGMRSPRRVALALSLILSACSRSPAPQSGPASSSAPSASAASAPGRAPTLAEVRARVPASWPLDLGAQPALGERGMVVTDCGPATRVGVDVLRRGGNAVDAAVAVAFALAVALPQAGNVAGGGFMVLRTSKGESAALDFRETAPAKAQRDLYAAIKDKQPDASLVGALAAGVPGTVAGLWAAHEKYGTLPWKDLVAPAIRLAEEGFVVDDELEDDIKRRAKDFARFPASAAIYLPGGAPIAKGALLKNPDLARVLGRIAEAGPKGFYEGETADLVLSAMKQGSGIITREDLAAYKPKWRTPVEVDYRGNHVISMPPPSSGGLVLALALRVLEGYDLRGLGWHTPDAIHIQAETMRRAFARRNDLLGDPDFITVPVDRFLAPAAADELRASIRKDRATPSSEVGPGVEDKQKHTTHFSIVDAQGSAVAVTTTINTTFGAAMVVPGGGFLLNNEMDDFATEPGKANVFGLVQGEANAIAPGKRMLSSMTPTIVVGPDGKVRVVTGAAGGPRIISGVLSVVTNVIDGDLGAVAAVSAPRLHHQHLPDQISYEEHGLPDEVIASLKALGHTMKPTQHVADAPTIVRQGGVWAGAREARNGSSLAMGY